MTTHLLVAVYAGLTHRNPSAGGLPIGAVLVKQHVADVMLPGDHGSTFAGNPLVCHAANAVVDVISDPAFLSGVRFGASDAFRLF